MLATIEMRAIPHWQTWLREYDRLTLLNMSIHHLDCFRYLFGDPESIYVSVGQDPANGICAPRRHRALHPGIRERHARVGLGRRVGRSGS